MKNIRSQTNTFVLTCFLQLLAPILAIGQEPVQGKVYEFEPLTQEQFDTIRKMAYEALPKLACEVSYKAFDCQIQIKRTTAVFDGQEMLVIAYSTKPYTVSFDDISITGNLRTDDRVIQTYPTESDAANVILSLKIALGQKDLLSVKEIDDCQKWLKGSLSQATPVPVPSLPPRTIPKSEPRRYLPRIYRDLIDLA